MQNAIDTMAAAIAERLEGRLYGFWLCGSVVLGDFRPGWSDIDFAHYEGIRSCAVQTDESLYACGWLLDLARCVYTLRYWDVIGKTRAGLWALEEGLFPEEEALRRTLEIRQSPAAFRDREDVKRWLRSLGPTVQRCADVLERELRRAEAAADREAFSGA